VRANYGRSNITITKKKRQRIAGEGRRPTAYSAIAMYAVDNRVVRVLQIKGPVNIRREVVSKEALEKINAQASGKP
jgi:hypothetical protein